MEQQKLKLFFILTTVCVLVSSLMFMGCSKEEIEGIREENGIEIHYDYYDYKVVEGYCDMCHYKSNKVFKYEDYPRQFFYFGNRCVSSTKVGDSTIFFLCEKCLKEKGFTFCECGNRLKVER